MPQHDPFQIKKLHNATAFDDTDNLNGEILGLRSDEGVWIWFATEDDYDGVVHFEVCPNINDASPIWFPIESRQLDDSTQRSETVTSPTSSTSYVVPVPFIANFRARMSDGTKGSLTVYVRRMSSGGY